MQFTRTPPAVHQLASQLLLEHLAWADYGRCCPAQTLLSILFVACQRLSSLFAAARWLRGAPSGETVRQALLHNLPNHERLERRFQRAPQAALPRLCRRRRGHRLAIDLTLLPYHGRPWRAADELYRGQCKRGTTHFHAYATAYLIQHGPRATVARTWVRQGERLAAVLRRLLAAARRAGGRPGGLLLDRGFYAADVIRYLQAARRPFLMPVPLKGRKADHAKGPGGTRVFAAWKRSGFATYRLHPTGGQTAAVRIGVHGRNRRGRRGKRGRACLAYACWGWQPSAAAQLSACSSARFGIETSYRQMNQGRARTCTRHPVVRLFLVGVALVLRNVWVWLHWEVLSGKRRGGRRLPVGRLPLRALLLPLLQVAVAAFGWRDAVPTERPIHQHVGAR